MRTLAQATLDERTVIEGLLERAVQTGANQMAAILADHEIAATGGPAALEIPIIGMAMSSGEMRTAVLLAAREVDAAISRLETGAGQEYVTPALMSAIEEIHRAMAALQNETPAHLQAPIGPANRGVEERYRARFARPVLALVEEAETAIVTAEAREVDVKEPLERAAPVLAVFAIIAVVGCAIYFAGHSS